MNRPFELGARVRLRKPPAGDVDNKLGCGAVVAYDPPPSKGSVEHVVVESDHPTLGKVRTSSRPDEWERDEP